MTMSQKSETLTCRRILSLMAISCFMCHQALRVNMSIAIVAMTTENGTHFSWDEKEKGDILGTFSWGCVLMGIPSGRLADIYGSRKLLGTSMLLASILTILTPAAANLSYYALLALRFGVGLAVSVCNTCVPPLAVKWIAATSMSKFLAHTKATHLGSALSLPLCGVLIANFGWESVFYVTGGVTLVWCGLWFCLVYDSPQKHPRISEEEKEKIEKEVITGTNGKKRRVPWGKIVTSRPVWVNILASGMYAFSISLAFNNLPSYMDQVLRFDVKKNGLLCSLPSLALYASAFGYSSLADKWKKSERFSTLTIRRIFLSILNGGSILMFVILLFFGDNPTICVIVFILWLSFCGCAVPSLSANVMDIARHYSGTVYGLMFTFGGLMGYLQTKVVAYIIAEDQSLEQWRYVFWLLIGVNILGMVIFLPFASSELQNWNFIYDEVESGETKSEQSKK